MTEIDHSSAERVKQLEAEILSYRETILMLANDRDVLIKEVQLKNAEIEAALRIISDLLDDGDETDRATAFKFQAEGE